MNGDIIGPEKLKPRNATGGTNLYSQNFGWSSPLVELPGRSGMNAGFGISYNSLVWLKVGDTMSFDPDHSNVSPGFRFGFPVIEPVFYDKGRDLWTYIIINPDGSRTALRQNGAGSYYHSENSSYLRLFTIGATNPNDPVEDIQIQVQGTDGSTMYYDWKGGAFRCNKILDRNGNFIVVDHSEQGLLTTVTDTLGRQINVSYNTALYPTAITQTWREGNGEGSTTTTHTWASFSYVDKTVSTDFDDLIGVYGPQNGATVKVLDKITYADGSATRFEYNGYIQAKKVLNIGGDSSTHVLSYVATNLDNPAADQTDCPRFTETRTWVENFNMSGGVPQEVIVNNTLTTNQSYSLPGSISGTATKIQVWMSGHPKDLRNNIFVGESDWQEGLNIATEDCLTTSASCTSRVRWSWTDWTQDAYGGVLQEHLENPRVIETRVGDSTNTKRTTTSYYEHIFGMDDHVAYYGLPSEIKVYDSGLSTVLKRSTIEYNNAFDYLSRRIIGLPAKVELYSPTSTLMSKVTFAYDEGGYDGSGQEVEPGVGHDNANYGGGMSYRGNRTSTTRWDVNQPTSSSYAVTSQVTYNTTGSVMTQIDPLGRETEFSYTDTFHPSPGVTTYAYPTTVTDPGGFSSTIRYRYDTGANVWAQSPAPAGYGNTHGKTTSRTFDDTNGRLIKEMVDNTGAYTEYEYAETGNAVTTYSTVVDANGDATINGSDEVATLTEFDGAGRVRRTRTENPDGASLYTAKLVEYDKLGRVKRETVPTLTNSSWQPTGDDNRGTDVWLWNAKEYDWKGRVERSIPSDSNINGDQDTIYEYNGCGCVGDETIIQGPLVPRDDTSGNARRKQRITRNILGLTTKTEIFQWDGATVYSTVVNEYNGRDQVTSIKEYVGTNGTMQQTAMTYDGHGRLSGKLLPQWGGYTTYTYNADDTVATVFDPRGASTAYTYGKPDDQYTEDRALVTKIEYAPPSTNPTPPNNLYIPDVPDVTFSYDAAGNRLQMTDGTGTLDYEYDELSRLKKETKDFTDDFNATPPSGGYFLKYEYHLSGGLKEIEDSFGQKTTYAADKIGRITSIGDQSSSTAYVPGISHRAFGGIKSMTMSTTAQTTLTMAYDNALRPATYTAANTTSGTIQSASYVYNNDGLVKGVDNTAAPEIDQVSTYDFAGRLSANAAGPLGQYLQYDAFSNLTRRENVFWQFNDVFEAEYTNNRKTSSGPVVMRDVLDDAGNVVYTRFEPYSPHGDRPYNDTKWWTFDAAGRLSYFSGFTTGTTSNPARETKQDVTYDGDGRQVMEYKRERGCDMEPGPEECENDWVGVPVYSLVSSVTGQTINVLSEYGCEMHLVSMGKTLIGSYTPAEGGYREFTLRDPVTGSSAGMTADGTVNPSSRTELAALGTAVPLHEPESYPVIENSDIGFAGDSEFGCRDEYGDPEPCSFSRVRAHAAGLEDRKRKRKAKEPISVVVPRNMPKMPFASPERGPSAGLSARYSGSLNEPDPEDPCPWDTDGTKDCSMTVNDESTDPLMRLFDMKGGTINDEWSLNSRPTRPWFTPVDEGLAAARNALANPKCVALFTTMGASSLKTPLEMLNTYASNGLITVGTANASGEKFSSAGTGASTSFAKGSFINSSGKKESASPITINQSGFFFTGLIDGGLKVQSVKGGGFEGLDISSVRAAVIIHELLHVAGAIPFDNPKTLNDNGAQSMSNAELVRKNCFGK